MTVVLVLGAGGSDGGRFIDGALAELAASSGFEATHSSVIVGTSIGAVRAAAVGSAVRAPTTVTEATRLLAGPRPTSTTADRMARRLRLLLGRAASRLVPANRPPPGWPTPPAPHHRGAMVLSVDLDLARRTLHRLAESADPASAVRASAAVPFVAGPVVLDGRRHGDGALWSPTSADVAAQFDPTLVIVIAPMVPRSGGSLLGRLHRRQLRGELGELPASTSVLVVCPEPGPRRRSRTESAGRAAVRDVRTRRPAGSDRSCRARSDSTWARLARGRTGGLPDDRGVRDPHGTPGRYPPRG